MMGNNQSSTCEGWCGGILRTDDISIISKSPEGEGLRNKITTNYDNTDLHFFSKYLEARFLLFSIFRISEFQDNNFVLSYHLTIIKTSFFRISKRPLTLGLGIGR